MISCGLVGEKLGHSWSADIHRQFGYEYRLYEVPANGFETFIRNCGLNGVNITVPYKKAAFSVCDEVSAEAAECGSVNTITLKNNKITGYNTDVIGFDAAVERSSVLLSGKKVLVIGNGGASAAVQYVLRRRNAVFDIISGKRENTEINLRKFSQAEILINASPSGMFPNSSDCPVNLAMFPELQAVFDLIYNPLNTPLLLHAKRRGIPAYDGLYMLAAQAIASAQLFLGEPVAANADAVCRTLLQKYRNIVLIGLPGVGKSTLAKLLSDQTGCDCLDSDLEYEKLFSESPAQTITAFGEEVFRRRETEVLRNLCSRTGVIISAGGGAAESPENYDILSQNGTLFLLSRPESQLPDNGRPLSIKYGISALSKRRMPVYKEWCDYEIDACDLISASKRILEILR